MLDKATLPDTRAIRHEATRERILKAAWRLARRHGITGLSLREVAKAVGMRAPSLYSYFGSKFDLYDAMFAQANAELREALRDWPSTGDFSDELTNATRRFIEFSVSDPARHQLLFQPAIPGFQPSAESYAIAVEVLEQTRRRFEDAGIGDPKALDLWTALSGGLVNQQMANDPGGDRWVRLLDEVVEMFLKHVGYKRKGARR